MKKTDWLIILAFAITVPYAAKTLFTAEPEPESFGYEPEYDTWIARYEGYYFPSNCGIDHNPGVSFFTDITTSDGTRITDTVEVMHDCEFILLDEDVKKGKPSSLQEGRFYRLEIVVIKAYVENDGWYWFEQWDWELGDTPLHPKTLYFSHHAELVK